MFSTSGGYLDACRGYHEYIGGCSVRREVHDAFGGYHEYIGDVQYISKLKAFTTLLPHIHHDIPSTY